MRVLITAIGSRGDVAPYVGLGCRIRDAGHPVAVAAHRQFAGMAREHSLEFREVPGELHDLVPQPAERRASPRQLAERIERTTRYMREVGRGVLDAAERGADVLLQCGSVPFGYHVANGLGIPSMGVFLQAARTIRGLPAVPAQHIAIGGTVGKPDVGEHRVGDGVPDRLVIPSRGIHCGFLVGVRPGGAGEGRCVARPLGSMPGVGGSGIEPGSGG
ncbi:glycosyltransferase [Saccharopolyspora pogona]|uniref:glycosyltransferase n=1 Tax=Saccharopolyspora pogona TaxID=333966 RepID=UPI001689A5CE|nr:glycosyltransferase [Saccharopolyspora pogona]